MKAISYFVAGFLALISATAFAANLNCPRYSAPGKFNNLPKQWGASDTGVITDGFIDLNNGEEKIFEVLHGSDISSYNQMNYQRIKECGGTFSFVRVDAMFDVHANSLKEYGIIPLPYVYFRIPTDLRRANNYSEAGIGSPKLSEVTNQFKKIGITAAAQFIRDVEKTSPPLDVINMGGIRGKVVAVDIEEKFVDEPRSTSAQRVAYGRGYARALCTWVTEVRRKFPDLIVFVYTMPAVYGDYLRYALPADNACINGLPVWLAHTTGDAGDSLYSSVRNAATSFSDESAQRLCDLSGGNRCVVHQYSHRATFAAQGKADKGVLPHHDVDRWFPIKVVNTPSGNQYIRRDTIPPLRGKRGSKLATASNINY